MPDTPTELDALIARLEAASGPSRGLDALISYAVKGQWALMDGDEKLARMDKFTAAVESCDEEKIAVADHFTASLDAALTLVPDGFHWSVYDTDGGTDANAQVEPPNFSTAPWNGTSKTPALALCIAALRARAALVEGE